MYCGSLSNQTNIVIQISIIFILDKLFIVHVYTRCDYQSQLFFSVVIIIFLNKFQ